MDGVFLSGFMLFAALFFVGLNGLFVLAEFSFATLRGTQVERLVVVGGPAMSPRANLLGLLTKSGLGVAVCGDDLRVRCPRGAPRLQGSRQPNKGIRCVRGRGRKLR